MKIEMKIQVHNPEHQIPMIVTIPETGVTKYPTLVMCHGTASDKHEAGGLYDALAEQLEKAGIASVRFDFIGTGDSDIDYIDYTLTTAVGDVKEVLAYVKAHEALDEERVGIIGFSQGGSIAMLSVGEMEEFKCLIGWSAALALGSMVTPTMREEINAQGWSWMRFDYRTPLRLSKQWMDESDQMELLPIVERRNLPTLAIAGTLDTVVDWHCSEKMVQASNHAASELYLVEGDHIFSVLEHDRVWPDVVAKTVSWCSENL